MTDWEEIRSEPCRCAPGACAAFVEPDAECINRLSGEVKTMHCEKCHPGGTGSTWHQNGECLRCRSLL